MGQRTHFALITVLTLAMVGVTIMVSSTTGAQTMASPAANSGTPVNCTVWRASASDPLGPDQCSESRPWWTVWSNCPVTPIHGSPGSVDPGLARVPWVQAEPASAGVIGFLFFGNRPLHTNGQFPDGASGKTLWLFDRAVTGLSITATDLHGQHPPVTLRKAEENDALGGRQWPSNMSIPDPGCWQVDLRAQSKNGPVQASVTFIVVE